MERCDCYQGGVRRCKKSVKSRQLSGGMTVVKEV